MPITLESPEITLNDYRALRDGREVPEKLSEATPAAAPGEAETATDPETVDTPEEPKETEKPKSPPKRGMVDEIVKLRNANRELQARLETPKPASPPSPAEAKPAAPAPVIVAPPAEDPEPTQDKYTDYNLYLRDAIKWGIRQGNREQAAENARNEQRQAALTKASTWNERVKAASSTRPDFQAIALNVDLPVSNAMGDAITDSELGAEILYHLGSHPEEAARISQLSAVAQIREIGKLEVSLAKPFETGDEGDDEEPLPKATPVSKAPAPISKPSGGVSKPSPAKMLESMTQSEYRAYREAGKL